MSLYVNKREFQNHEQKSGCRVVNLNRAYWMPMSGKASYPINIKYDFTRGNIIGTDSSRKSYIFKIIPGNIYAKGLYLDKACTIPYNVYDIAGLHQHNCAHVSYSI